ncbi:MAG TPA: copper oxidase [Thermoanaerobaculia bacterium]|nr:copper oxidase [Thermoanaerobaculia bacterium]
MRSPGRQFCISVVLTVSSLGRAAQAETTCGPANTVHASVVALDQVVMVNRLGAVRPNGMIYALQGDVVPATPGSSLSPGNVMLRPGKRPRPLVLRVNQGDCLEIQFWNLLNPTPENPLQPVTRNASVHVTGMQLVNGIAGDGTYAGANPAQGGNLSGVVAPGNHAVYTLYAEAEGSYLMYSTPADFNGFNTMQLTMGLFGAVNVEPRRSEWYRSQVSQADFQAASRFVPAAGGAPAHYEVHYDARDAGGKPLLRMLDPATRTIVHGDLTAVVTGPGHGELAAEDVAGLPPNPALPDRRQPFREITVHYHESQDLVQAFPFVYSSPNQEISDSNAGEDGFAINYGAAGITSEILANRFGVGPARDCADCKFEEFFLNSWSGGDPAMIVDFPANLPCTTAQMLAEDLAFQADSASPPAAPCAPGPYPKATMAFFPDDPSNVYHTYLGDHVQFRILHAGAAVHHVHHHHAHQWLHSPKSDESHYLDSQAIGPGASFSLDLVYHGSGNLNLTVGDSIFHCHFYPHFASGMWALFRVHDVFEAGTELDAAGRPKPGARALPDGEITTGTPIPAVVPLPTRAMAPLPAPVRIVNGQVQLAGEGHPGYPFFVPGMAGRRAPHPPLDFATETKDGQVERLDGGLPRHLVLGATVLNEQHTPTDFSKDLGAITAVELPEKGTPAETAAMRYFGQRRHASFTPAGQRADFLVNGLPRGAQPGAPFADPGVDLAGAPVGDLEHGKPRLYKGVNLQIDAVFNKKGWHYPQQRMMALWSDVPDILSGRQAPEPLFFRANSRELVEYWHSNLVPAYYELDDFQVRTPTDVLGQHIHLVKFDVLASDGAANGFNYEDGTFSPDEVRSRIAGINQAGGLWSFDRRSQKTLLAKPIQDFGDGPLGQWVGAQATVQRWYVDPLFDARERDRTYMTVFTHDHFGPSTHQEAGLYGGLLVEPRCSRWTSPDGKQVYGSRADGGPTGFAANIVPMTDSSPACRRAEKVESYREFALVWGDLQLAYQPTSKSLPDCYTYGANGQLGQTPQNTRCAAVASNAGYTGWSDPANALNCVGCSVASDGAVSAPSVVMNGGMGLAASPPTPRLVSDFGTGTFSLNYRNEPLPLRVALPANGAALDPAAGPEALDLSHAFRSIPRYDAAMSTQPKPGSFLNPHCIGADCLRFPVDCPLAASGGPANGCGVLPADPYTPLLRAYENDPVQIRVLAGAFTSMHDFTLHGLKWLFEPESRNSGYRNSQLVILSEHYEMLFRMPSLAGERPAADYLYNPSASYEGLVNGIWGLLRSYRGPVENLARLPNNQNDPVSSGPATGLVPPAGSSTQCTQGAPCVREFRISATTVRQATGDARGLLYNSRGALTGQDANGNPQFGANPLHDPDALIYVRDEDLDAQGRLRPGVPLEPLVLRAAAGDWLRVRLTNRFDPSDCVFTLGQSAAKPAGTAPYTNPYSSVLIHPSAAVGLHAQLVAFDVTHGDGANVGVNPVQTVAPGDPPCSGSAFPCRDYLWYAGNLESSSGAPQATPVELGTVNLTPADPLLHVYHGLFGVLVVEPLGATWREDTDSRASATVFPRDGAPFREFVVAAQDDVNMVLNGHSLYAAGNNLSAFNYRSEPFFYRFGALMNPALGASAPADWGHLSPGDLAATGAFQFTGLDTTPAVSNTLVAGDPQTPVFRAPAGMPVRFRLADPGGIGDNQQVFELTGHVWEEEPYTRDSTVIGHNPLSEATGVTGAYGPTSHYDVVLAAAGGANRVPGDYLYRSWTANQYQAGLWGLFRVGPAACSPAPAGCPDTVTLGAVQAGGSGFTVAGVNTVSPQTRAFAPSVTLSYGSPATTAQVPVGPDGRWTYSAAGSVPQTLTVTSAGGGIAVYGSGPPAAPPAAHAQAVKKRQRFTRH